MKDAISGTTLLQIFVIFFVIFIILMSSIINYTKTFRIKNQIINIIEKNDGYNDKAVSEINSFLTDNSIYDVCIDSNNAKTSKCGIKKNVAGVNNLGSYYKVTLYSKFELPLIKSSIDIPVSGETKVFYNDNLVEGSSLAFSVINEGNESSIGLPTLVLSTTKASGGSSGGNSGGSSGSGGSSCMSACKASGTSDKQCRIDCCLNSSEATCKDSSPKKCASKTGWQYCVCMGKSRSECGAPTTTTTTVKSGGGSSGGSSGGSKKCTGACNTCCKKAGGSAQQCRINCK